MWAVGHALQRSSQRSVYAPHVVVVPSLPVVPALPACLSVCVPACQGVSLPRFPVIVGEFGAKDFGDGSKDNTDTTKYSAYDQVWFAETAAYLRALSAKAGVPLSWLFWAWNANSGVQDVAARAK